MWTSAPKNDFVYTYKQDYLILIVKFKEYMHMGHGVKDDDFFCFLFYVYYNDILGLLGLVIFSSPKK